MQTDSVNEPFDVNRGGRINLGSTAKLRTLITYLQIVSDLHALREPVERGAGAREARPDRRLSLALDYCRIRDRSLQAMLDAAVERKYSAAGRVHTGGAQVFSNFEKSDNGRIPDAAQGVRAFGQPRSCG